MTLRITTPPPILQQFPPQAVDTLFNEPPDPNLLALLTFPDPPYLVTNPSNKINNVENLRTLLPPTWFTEDDQILDAVLATFADSIETIKARNDWIYQQDRIMTASGIWLDMYAEEFFGAGIITTDETNAGWMFRRAGEGDTSYRSRILFELMAQRNTRKGMHDMLKFWCGGVEPTIIEPWNPNDTGTWDGHTFFCDAAGYWGSNDDPWTTFIITHRAGGVPLQTLNDETPTNFQTHTPGIIGTNVVTNTNYLYGGWDQGSFFWIDDEFNQSLVSDIDLYGVLNRTKPEGTKTFIHLSDSQQLPNDPAKMSLFLLNYNFILDVSTLSDGSSVLNFVGPPPGYANTFLDLNFILDESVLALEPGLASQGVPIPEPLPGFMDKDFHADSNSAL